MKYQECALSELDIFQPAPIQNSITKFENILFHPVTSLDNGILEFFLPRAPDLYRDLNSATLHLKVQILKKDSTLYKENIVMKDVGGKSTIDAEKSADRVENQPSFVSSPISSIFKTVSVSMNGKAVSFIDNYHYKMYFDKILNYNENTVKTALANEGFTKDEINDFDSIEKTSKGFNQRREYTKNSAVWDLVGRMNVDCMNLNRLLLGNVDVRIVFTQENPDFFIMEGPNDSCMVKIIEAFIQVKHYHVNPSIVLEHYRILNDGVKAVYPYKKTEIKTFTISSGTQSVNFDNIYSGRLPNSILLGLIANSRFIGNRQKNPFFFTNNRLSSLGIYINGHCVTQYPIEMNFDANQFGRAYNQMVEATGALFSDNTNSITKFEFKKGYCLFPFIFSPTQNLDAGECSSTPLDGTLKVEIKFGAHTTETLTLICYAEFDACFLVDKFFNVTQNL